MCAFTKIRFYAVSVAFLFKKHLLFYVKSGILYPNGAPWIQEQRSTCIAGAYSPLRSVLDFAIFFIYLLIIYPACPQGQSGGPTCTGRRFSFGYCLYCTKTAPPNWERCPLDALHSPSKPCIIQTVQAALPADRPPRQGGRRPVHGPEGAVPAPC